MILQNNKAIVVMALLLLTCVSVKAAERSSSPAVPKALTAPIIQGSIMQPWYLSSITPAMWKNELQAMTSLGMKQLVVQFVMYNGKVFYEGSVFPSIGEVDYHFLEVILKEAQELGLEVMVGLSYEQQWFNGTTAYFSKSLETCSRLLKELDPVVNQYKSFSGFYLTDEISDAVYQSADQRKALAEYFTEMIKHCDAVSGGKPVAISPYYSSKMKADELYAWWNDFLSQTGIDVLMFQDGVGVHGGKRLDALPAVYNALSRACKNNKVHFHCHPMALEKLKYCR